MRDSMFPRILLFRSGVRCGAETQILANPPIAIEYAAPVLALVNIGISVPLLLKKIPPNRFYGFRTRKTLSDRGIWYEANFKGAVNLILASLVAMVLAVVVSDALDPVIAPHVNIFILVIAVSVAMVISLIQVKNL